MRQPANSIITNINLLLDDKVKELLSHFDG
jgi:hypothetical protein